MLGKLAYTRMCWCHDCQGNGSRSEHLVYKRRWRAKEKRQWQRAQAADQQ